MKYRQEQTQKNIKTIFNYFKTIIKKIFSILTVVVLIIVLVISINFFKYIVFGKSTLSEFKNNFFGIPTNKLLQINQQLQNQHDLFKQWLTNLKSRISS
jgi:amino acid permease